MSSPSHRAPKTRTAYRNLLLTCTILFALYEAIDAVSLSTPAALGMTFALAAAAATFALAAGVRHLERTDPRSSAA